MHRKNSGSSTAASRVSEAGEDVLLRRGPVLRVEGTLVRFGVGESALSFLKCDECVLPNIHRLCATCGSQAEMCWFSAGRVEGPPADRMERELRTFVKLRDCILPGKDILSHLTYGMIDVECYEKE